MTLFGDVEGGMSADQLAVGETLIPTEPVRPIQWSLQKYEAAQLLALSRHSVQEISDMIKIPVASINKWKQHPDFRKYMNKLLQETAETMKSYRLQVLSKILDARLALAEEHNNYASLSTKDTLDILDSIRKETESEDNKEHSNYMKLIEVLITDTATKKALPVPETSSKGA